MIVNIDSSTGPRRAPFTTYGYLAAAASRVSMWWSGNRRSPALTADADSGAGLQGGNDDEVPSSDGDSNLEPLEGDSTTTPSDP